MLAEERAVKTSSTITRASHNLRAAQEEFMTRQRGRAALTYIEPPSQRRCRRRANHHDDVGVLQQLRGVTVLAQRLRRARLQ